MQQQDTQQMTPQHQGVGVGVGCMSNGSGNAIGTITNPNNANTVAYKDPSLLGTPANSPPDDSAINDTSITCVGCGHHILERYYLLAADRRWHMSCLQCSNCRCSLGEDITCYFRDGRIYCKQDYYRLFGKRTCGRCQTVILASELVMRVRELVFHLSCFRCEACQRPLRKGDHFGLREGTVLCRLHYELTLSEPIAMVQHQLVHPLTNNNINMNNINSPTTSMPTNTCMSSCLSTPTTGIAMTHPRSVEMNPPTPYSNGVNNTTRQKGRPRKRKPKEIVFTSDLNSDFLDMPFGRSPGTPGMSGSNQRTKRMRTSFKHHQLRTMKSYFAINHNPDAKDLKQLSQKTGLPKRVLQVWFQNARAKWRRMMLKQEGKSGDKCSGSDGGLGDLDVYPHGPGSISGSCQSLPPRSPPFMLPPGSPSSLDCS